MGINSDIFPFVMNLINWIVIGAGLLIVWYCANKLAEFDDKED